VIGLGKVLDFPPPAELPESAAATWRLLVPELAAVGWVDLVDREMLTQLCYACGLAAELRRAIERDGVMLPTYVRDGNEVGSHLNPAVNAHARQQAVIKSIGEQFGLTPSARARLGLTVAKGIQAARVLTDDDGGVIEV
jgi:P27 family predicted phage terminase small subunit